MNNSALGPTPNTNALYCWSSHYPGKEINTELGNGSEVEDPLDQDAAEGVERTVGWEARLLKQMYIKLRD